MAYKMDWKMLEPALKMLKLLLGECSIERQKAYEEEKSTYGVRYNFYGALYGWLDSKWDELLNMTDEEFEEKSEI